MRFLCLVRDTIELNLSAYALWSPAVDPVIKQLLLLESDHRVCSDPLQGRLDLAGDVFVRYTVQQVAVALIEPLDLLAILIEKLSLMLLLDKLDHL